MRKKIAVVIAAALMTLSASSAFAAFADQDLIRVVYDTTAGATFEQADNLGNINTLLSNSATTHDLTVGSTINLGAGSNLRVAYFAIATSGSGLSATDKLWIGATGTTLTNVGQAAAYSQFKFVENVYNTLSGAGTIANANSQDLVSYYNKLASGGTNPGGDAGLFNATYAPTTDISLSNLASGNIVMNMFAFANTKKAGTGVLQSGFTITTDTTGHTIINATTTPIPAAAYLLGSGLLGLFGIRRKGNKA